MQIANIIINGKTVLGFKKQEKIAVFDFDFSQKNNIPTTMDEIVQKNLNEIQSLLEVVNSVNEDSPFISLYSLEEVKFDAPVPRGKKIICVGLNYKKHAEESNMELPKVPLLFSKFDNTLIGHNNHVKKPNQTQQMDYEAEVAMVIGQQARNVSRERALEFVFGYTCANDLSARDLQFITSQWLVGKNCDSFCPAGPFLVTAEEIPNPNELTISCTVNGKKEQEASTAQLIFPFDELVSYISHCFTLEPGDLILTGTPDGVIFGKPESEQNWLEPGDEIVVEIEKLGKLRTIVS